MTLSPGEVAKVENERPAKAEEQGPWVTVVKNSLREIGEGEEAVASEGTSKGAKHRRMPADTQRCGGRRYLVEDAGGRKLEAMEEVEHEPWDSNVGSHQCIRCCEPHRERESERPGTTVLVMSAPEFLDGGRQISEKGRIIVGSRRRSSSLL